MPDFMPDKYEVLYSEDTAWELYKILSDVDFSGRKYEKYNFDCTNMSAYLFDYLREKGYECTIIVGFRNFFDIFKTFSDEGRHAWIIAEKNGNFFVVESTSLEIKKPDDLSCYEEYRIRFYFKSLFFLRFITSLAGKPDEWAY
jgi:hypothetical protein